MECWHQWISYVWVSHTLEIVTTQWLMIWTNSNRKYSSIIPFALILQMIICVINPETMVSVRISMICDCVTFAFVFHNSICLRTYQSSICANCCHVEVPLRIFKFVMERIHPEFMFSWRISMESREWEISSWVTQTLIIAITKVLWVRTDKLFIVIEVPFQIVFAISSTAWSPELMISLWVSMMSHLMA